jgi:hypothetical protein
MWLDIGMVALLIFAAYAFISYAGSPRQQRRYARRHGGSWTDEQHKT